MMGLWNGWASTLTEGSWAQVEATPSVSILVQINCSHMFEHIFLVLLLKVLLARKTLFQGLDGATAAFGLKRKSAKTTAWTSLLELLTTLTFRYKLKVMTHGCPESCTTGLIKLYNLCSVWISNQHLIKSSFKMSTYLLSCRLSQNSLDSWSLISW